MDRLIVNNKDSSLSSMDALKLVQSVVDGGMISNGPNGEQYCFATAFTSSIVYADKTKTGSHSFTILRTKPACHKCHSILTAGEIPDGMCNNCAKPWRGSDND